MTIPMFPLEILAHLIMGMTPRTLLGILRNCGKCTNFSKHRNAQHLAPKVSEQWSWLKPIIYQSLNQVFSTLSASSPQQWLLDRTVTGYWAPESTSYCVTCCVNINSFRLPRVPITIKPITIIIRIIIDVIIPIYRWENQGSVRWNN